MSGIAALYGRMSPRYIRTMQRPLLVGVAGGSGSGKTTVIRALREALPAGAVALISQDDYYRPIAEQFVDANGQVNFDLPDSIEMDRLLADVEVLCGGGTLRRQEYTFNQPGVTPEWIEVLPAPVILVEGLFVFHHTPLRERFHLKVFIDADEQVQLQRRLARDAAERGYGPEEVKYQWENHVMPAYRNYLLPYRERCEVRLDNGACYQAGVRSLADRLLADLVAVEQRRSTHRHQAV